MLELKNITVKEFIELEIKDPYLFAMKYAFAFTTPENTLEIKDVTELEFGFIKDVQYSLENEYTFFEQLKHMEQITSKNIGQMKLTDYCRGASWFIKEIYELNKKEAYLLQTNEVWEHAEKFEGLGVYLQKRQIAHQFHCTPQQVDKMTYAICITELYTQKLFSEVERIEMKKHAKL